MNEICMLGKNFREFIPEEEIKRRVEELARQINSDLADKDVIFLGILNGAFLFAADLFRRIQFPSKISFVKLASYEGTSSSGAIRELIGWNDEIKNKTIVIIEDIVDTGNTIERIVGELLIRKAYEIKIAALFFKPAAYLKSIDIDYVGFEIPDNFVVGYGLDYDGYGRNLPSVYTLVS
ncbi:MAG: hypoxanthine phosphoribosyltransferase [Bacteroidales bacterium]|nr:hypoxanthine phosphoribosyltransferase [Bacteroidales bacterium]